MGSTPQTTNGTATIVNEIIKAGENVAVDAVEAAIIVDVPFLATPGIKQIWEALFYFVATYFVKIAETGATFAVIDVQIGDEESAISKALQDLIAAEKSGDQDAIKKAIKAYADAQSALAHSDGSANPQ